MKDRPSVEVLGSVPVGAPCSVHFPAEQDEILLCTTITSSIGECNFCYKLFEIEKAWIEWGTVERQKQSQCRHGYSVHAQRTNLLFHFSTNSTSPSAFRGKSVKAAWVTVFYVTVLASAPSQRRCTQKWGRERHLLQSHRCEWHYTSGAHALSTRTVQLSSGHTPGKYASLIALWKGKTMMTADVVKDFYRVQNKYKNPAFNCLTGTAN